MKNTLGDLNNLSPQLMSQYSFKKTTCERYDFRFGDLGWAIITIDENGGVFNCQSDYGDYAYSWPNHGRLTFKHFLIEIARDYHYLLNKVASQTHFDFDKALIEWKQEIIKLRKERECTAEQAREAWEAILELDDYSNHPDIVAYKLYENRAITTLCCEPWYMFEVEKDYSPSAYAFAKEIMPMLAEVLKGELANESTLNT